MQQHELFFSNKAVTSFLKNKENENLLLNTICNPSKENVENLDETFKKFYFNIRFISYISSALYFNAINFDKKIRKVKNRHPLTVDKPLGSTEEGSFKELIHDSTADIQLDDLVGSDNIAEYIENPVLYEAVEKLSDKQNEILSLAYIKKKSDTEIAKILNKSQQAISKSHKKALQIIYDHMH
jgi:RNA polymerase sigma factor (sigma-70 family)